MSKYKSINNFHFFIFILFLHYMTMESLASNNDIDSIKGAKKLLNETRTNLSCEETKRIRKKNLQKGKCL